MFPYTTEDIVENGVHGSYKPKKQGETPRGSVTLHSYQGLDSSHRKSEIGMGKKLFISILYHIGYVNTIRRQYRVRIVITGGREKYIRNRISTAHGKESEEQQSGGQKTGSEKELLPTSTSWSKKRKWAEAGGQSWTEGRWKGWSLASIEEMQLRHTRANSSYLSAFFREL